MPLRVDELHMELSPLPERGANTGAAFAGLVRWSFGECRDAEFIFSVFGSNREQTGAVGTHDRRGIA